MNQVQLLLAIHCHQPVGNFESVFAEAYERCYRPLLDHLAKFPAVKISLHLTGPLLEWLDENHADYLQDVGALVRRGQVEVLGGGFYEPMLAILPDNDARGQIERMKEYCAAKFDSTPSGMWLAERVWEPDLARVIASTGTRFTLLDDSHFHGAGLPPEPLRGYYVTEKAGSTLAIFPIDKGLRYRIPFKPVKEVIAYLRSAAGPGSRGLCYGDDGEKLGLWPDTWEWVYGKGWLDELFGALTQEAEVIEMMHFSEYLNRYPPSGRIYLPAASYEEMMEWSLPAEAGRRYRRFKTGALADPALAPDIQFVRGGIWQGFLAKYPEANALHKRMLHVSRKLVEAETEKGVGAGGLAEARTELYRGQCNCAYWHGLFGGLYLSNLRHAAFAALIRAENLIDQEMRGDGDFIEYEEDDLDGDLRDEAVMSNAHLCAWIDPGEGGTLFELDARSASFNLINTLSRADEAYHDLLREPLPSEAPPPEAEIEGVQTIHDRVKSKEPHLGRFLVVDGYRRACFIDRFHAPGLGLENIRAGGDGDIGDFATGSYQVEASGVEEDGDLSASITLSRDGHLRQGDQAVPLLVEKTYHLPIDVPQLEVEYILENRADQAVEMCFAPELNLNLLAGDAPDRYLDLGQGRRERLHLHANLGLRNELQLVDGWSGTRLTLAIDRDAEIWTYPIEAVSQSEGGFERTYQGSCFLLRMPVTLAVGTSARIKLTLSLSPFEPGRDDHA